MKFCSYIKIIIIIIPWSASACLVYISFSRLPQTALHVSLVYQCGVGHFSVITKTCFYGLHICILFFPKHLHMFDGGWKKKKKKERERKKRGKKIFLFGLFEYKKGKKKMRKLWGGHISNFDDINVKSPVTSLPLSPTCRLILSNSKQLGPTKIFSLQFCFFSLLSCNQTKEKKFLPYIFFVFPLILPNPNISLEFRTIA